MKIKNKYVNKILHTIKLAGMGQEYISCDQYMKSGVLVPSTEEKPIRRTLRK